VNITNISKQPENSQEITPKQAHALGVISVLVQKNPDFPPSLAEVAKYLDVKKQTVAQLLVILERKGYVTRSGGYRSVRLTDKPLPYATQRRQA
jgi:Mn-dependent DtxR family transcriptional regulator